MIRIFLMLFPLLGFSQAVDLRFSLEKKKEYPLFITSEVKIKQEINKQQVEVNAKTQSELIFKVLKQEKLTYISESKYKNASVTMQTIIDGKEMALGRIKNLVEEGISKIKDEKFNIHLTPKGKILTISPLSPLFEKIGADLFKKYQKKSPITTFQQKQIVEQLKSSFGEETLKTNLEAITLFFPSNKVSVGDSWAITSLLSNGMNTKMTTNYRLVERNKEHIIIEGKSIISVENERIFLEQGQLLTFSLEGESSSKIILDPKTKWIKNADIRQSFKGKTTTKGDASHPEEKVIPIETESHISVLGKN